MKAKVGMRPARTSRQSIELRPSGKVLLPETGARWFGSPVPSIKARRAPAATPGGFLFLRSTPGTRSFGCTIIGMRPPGGRNGTVRALEMARRETGIARAVAVTVTVAVLLALAACNQKQDAQTPAAPPVPAVGVAPASAKGVSRSYEFVGRIKATDKVDLRARVEGVLQHRLFTEGQIVRANDLLFQ